MPGGTERIFVLEDNAEVREFVVEALRSLGYDVVEAEDGASARAKLNEAGPIHLLLSDVVLPGGTSGPEFAAEFHERYPDAKVLFSSGYARELLSQRGQFDDTVELLSKPYSVGEMARRVRALLDDKD
jgi:CheY-like chemotaxis protein